MAKTTVEILGGQLDGTILNNMASEATMREMLAAVKKMNKDAEGPGGKNTNSPKTKLTKNVGVMSKLADELGNQIGNAVGALGTMGAMLATGNTKLSSYTRTLNDQVISKLPIFGGLLGGVGSLLNEGIEVLEDWNESLKQGTQSGATFGNSIIRASRAATAAGMGMDDYIKLVNQYSSTMLNLADTVTLGAEKFSSISNKLVRAGGVATKTLRQMGYSTYMVNESLLKYIEMVGMGMKNMKIDDRELAEDFNSFQLNLIRMGYLTGQNVKKLEEQMAVVSADTVFRMKLASLGTTERKKMLAAAQQFTSMYGEAGGELFKALFLGMPPGSEEARNLAVLMPELTRSMRDSIDSAKHGQANVDKYIEENEDRLIDAMVDSAKRGKGIEGMLAAAGAGYADAERLRKSIEPILRTLNRYGDLANVNTAQLKAAFKQARIEANEREKLTEFLNNFQMAMEELKFGLMEAFSPLLEDLGLYLESKDLPGKVKIFGTWLKESVDKYLPDVITFFKWLGDENGRSYIMNEISYFFTRMGIKFEYYVKEAFGFDSPAEYQRQMEADLEKAKTVYQDQQNKLKPLIENLRYIPPHKREGNQAPAGTGKIPEYAAQTAEKIAQLSPTIKRTSDDTIAALNKKGIQPFGRILPEGSYRIGDTMGENRDGGKRKHLGQDYKVATGTNVYAGMDGTVSYKWDDSGGGYVATLTSAEDPNLKLLYMHLTEETKNLKGGPVKKGAVIAKSGSTGTSTGPHLHVEGRYNDQRFNVPEFMRYRRGTLGNYGTLFKNFGSSTDVVLDDVEAVMTPQQMNAVMNTAGNVATVEMLQTLDRNFQRLVQVMVEKTNLTKSQLSIIEQNQVRIA